MNFVLAISPGDVIVDAQQNDIKLTLEQAETILGELSDGFRDYMIKLVWYEIEDMYHNLNQPEREIKDTIEEINGRWTCTACGYEWSAMMGDDEIPEFCECQTGWE